jgi:hypothetical protein
VPDEPRYDVFFSHAHQDADRVRAIVVELERRGYGAFFAPQSIPPGATWRDAIQQALRQARAFLAFISDSYVSSSAVDAELVAVLGRRTPMISVLLDNVDPDRLPVSLRSRQWLSLVGVPALEAGARIATALDCLEVEPSSRTSATSHGIAPALRVDATVLPDLPGARRAYNHGQAQSCRWSTDGRRARDSSGRAP